MGPEAREKLAGAVVDIFGLVSEALRTGIVQLTKVLTMFDEVLGRGLGVATINRNALGSDLEGLIIAVGMPRKG